MRLKIDNAEYTVRSGPDGTLVGPALAILAATEVSQAEALTVDAVVRHPRMDEEVLKGALLAVVGSFGRWMLIDVTGRITIGADGEEPPSVNNEFTLLFVMKDC